MLYIFIEGNDDQAFFSKLFFTKNTVFYQYATQKREKVNSFIRSIKQMPNSDYLFFGDGDGKTVNERIECLLRVYKELEKSKLFVVQYEIESWYYAGVTETDGTKLGLKRFEYCTDCITKEMLAAKMANSAERKYTLARMLDLYSIDLAEKRNTSFKAFSDYRKGPAVAV